MSVRTFTLVRYVDPTGVSGVGPVAEGVQFSDGTVVIRWTTVHRSTAIYASTEDAMWIHGHGGQTVLVFEDPQP